MSLKDNYFKFRTALIENPQELVEKERVLTNKILDEILLPIAEDIYLVAPYEAGFISN